MKWIKKGPNPGQPKFGWSAVDAVSTKESSTPVRLEGWSMTGGMVDMPEVGSDKVGPLTAEMSGDATKG